MSIRARKFAVYSQEEEQIDADDRNNNLQNGQVTEQNMIEKQPMVMDSRKTDSEALNQIDELRLKYQNSEEKMEKHANETQSNDSQSIEMAQTTKCNTAINFSVDSILSNSNWAKKIDVNSFNFKSSESSVSLPKLSTTEDFNRIHRPMPMRYMTNPSLYPGKCHSFQQIIFFLKENGCKC